MKRAASVGSNLVRFMVRSRISKGVAGFKGLSKGVAGFTGLSRGAAAVTGQGKEAAAVTRLDKKAAAVNCFLPVTVWPPPDENDLTFPAPRALLPSYLHGI